MTSTSEMTLFGSVNLSHGTDACLHYTLNDIMLQMTQVFIFTFVVQWRLGFCSGLLVETLCDQCYDKTEFASQQEVEVSCFAILSCLRNTHQSYFSILLIICLIN